MNQVFFVTVCCSVLWINVVRCNYVGYIDPLAGAAGAHSIHKRQTTQRFTREEIRSTLEAHNNVRSTVSPAAGDMKYMEWSSALESSATAWSMQCKWYHGQVDQNVKAGQNLYISTNRATCEEATIDWAAEVKDFEFCDNSRTRCQSQQPGCGHYTQIVWSKSNQVGCGRAFCPQVFNKDGSEYVRFRNSYIITCNYSPQGNIHGASSPGSSVFVLKDPYVLGERCSKCEPGSLCHRGLCVTREQCTKHNLQCGCERQCQNCGTLTPQCTCQCQPGFTGNDCSERCQNNHPWCGANPGWPARWCNSKSYVLENCPLLCGKCVASSGSSSGCCNGVTCPSGQILDTRTCSCTVARWDVCNGGSGVVGKPVTGSTQTVVSSTTTGGGTTSGSRTTSLTRTSTVGLATGRTSTGSTTNTATTTRTTKQVGTTTEIAPECVGLIDKYRSCPQWAMRGMCETHRFSDGQLLEEGCQKSCNVDCNINLQRNQCAALKDMYSHCAQWASRGFCETHRFRDGTLIEERCQKSCNPDCRLCSSLRDTHRNCKQWANMGHCETHRFSNGQLVEEKCQRSCNTDCV